jgi:hypothetical protein
VKVRNNIASKSHEVTHPQVPTTTIILRLF